MLAACLTISRSASDWTVVWVEAVLLPVDVSATAEVTWAWLVRVVPSGTSAGTSARMVMVRAVPLFMSPRSQVTVPALCAQVGLPGETETKVTDMGRVSVSWTEVATEGPVLVTCRV